jgi:hypothetical protein
LRHARPELDGDDIAFLLAIAGWLGYGLQPTPVGRYEFRVALSTVKSFLKTGKSKVVASRKKLEQLGVIVVTQPENQADHVPATYRVNIELIGTGVPAQDSGGQTSGFQGETLRGSDVGPRGVLPQDSAGFRRETVRRSLESKESMVIEDEPAVLADSRASDDGSHELMYAQIHGAIASDVDLSRITPADAIDEIAAEYMSSSSRIDVLATIRDAGDYLRTEKGRAIRNGRDHLLRRLDWAIKAAEKRNRAKDPPKPSPVAVDFSTQPLPPTRMIRVKF